MSNTPEKPDFSEDNRSWMKALEYHLAKVPAAYREDCRHEVWVRILQAKSRYVKENAQGATLSTFLRHQIKHAIQDYWRKEDKVRRDHRRKIQRGELPPVVHVPLGHKAMRRMDHEPGPDQRAMVKQVGRLLAYVETNDRYLLEQLYLAGRSMRELGREFGVTSGTIWQWRNQALARLRLKLGISVSAPMEPEPMELEELTKPTPGESSKTE